MNIQEFISHYKNHPVLFIGTGFSLRYLKNAYSWDGLLSKISLELTDNAEFYYDLKASCMLSGVCHFDRLATKLEKEFNQRLSKERETVNLKRLILFFMKT
ncbi:hypothetical protein [Candidatus Fukatsuia endosymbiont of Tuberolachnus salignus]|uniref:hypothetical protein n=1 Tax=Candidatus Fukatsuia endosymbiont of Tuberolachnus salignus TaxID=3077957 RepID=UPI00313AF070